MDWAFRECIDHYAYRLPKGRTTCMDYGHGWLMAEPSDSCTCPKCGARLKVRQTFERKLPQKQYFTVLTTSGEYQVLRKFLLVVEEMETEGRLMHHCVGGYHNRKNSLILSARIDGRRIETVEVSLKTFEVVQCRGVCNENTEYHDRIIALVNSNMSLIRQRMNAA